MKRVKIQSQLSVTPEKVWEWLNQTDTLFFITKGWVHFVDKTNFTTQWEQGQVIQTVIKPFVIGASAKYEIRITLVDDVAFTIKTEESGAGIKSWNHVMQVNSVSGSTATCQLIDVVEVDAGVLTGAFTVYVWCYYKWRHRRWKKLIRRRLYRSH
jgi:ligand-binding SRPBCC domain-containing protein